MQTAQGAAQEICQHYYPDLARDFVRYNNQVRDRQLATSFTKPDYNVNEDKAYCEHLSGVLNFILKTSKTSILDMTKHEEANLMLVIWYGYPELADAVFQTYKLPKDSFNRLFLMLGRYNKAIKRKHDLSTKKILRGIVLNDVLEPLVEVDPEDIPLTE